MSYGTVTPEPTAPTAPVIRASVNYNLFSFIDCNRDLSKSNLEKLKKQFESDFKQQFYPIVVDRDFRIIDGQHRFTACRQLKKPVYYVMKETYTNDYQEITSVNLAGKPHGSLDYLKMLIKERNPDALKLVEYCERYNGAYSLQCAMTILCSAHGTVGGGIKDNLSKGRIPFHDLPMSLSVLDCGVLHEANGFTSQAFVTALKRFCHVNEISPSAVTERLYTQGFFYKRGMTKNTCYEYIKNGWNKGRKKHKAK
jgi:hypothetical protein